MIALLLLIAIAIGVISVLLYMKKEKLMKTRVGVKEELVVGLSVGYKPFEFINQKGAVVGFDIDLIQEVARHMKRKVVVKNIDFQSLLKALIHSHVDVVISAMCITPERLKQVNMIPYHGEPLRSFALIFFNELSVEISKVEDLYKLPPGAIAVQLGTVQEAFFSQHDFIILKKFCGLNGVILDVLHGGSVAGIVLMDSAIALQPEYPKLQIIEIKLDVQDWMLGDGIAVRREDKELTRGIENIVVMLQKNGFIEKNHVKWFGKESCNK